MSDTEHANLEAVLLTAQPQAVTAMSEMKAAGLNLFQIFTLIATYGPALMNIFGQAGKYFQWIQDVVAAIKDGKPLPPLPA